MKIISVEIPYDSVDTFYEIKKWLLNNVGPGVANDVDAWRHKGNVWSLWTKDTGKNLTIVGEFLDVESAMQFKFAWS